MIKLNPGRQYALTLVQHFTAADLDGTNPVVAARLPRNAVILRGHVAVSTAFSTGTMNVGTEGDADALGALNLATVGVKPLTVNGQEVGYTDIKLTPSAAMAAGEGTLVIEYVITGRANEAQP